MRQSCSTTYDWNTMVVGSISCRGIPLFTFGDQTGWAGKWRTECFNTKLPFSISLNAVYAGQRETARKYLKKSALFIKPTLIACAITSYALTRSPFNSVLKGFRAFEYVNIKAFYCLLVQWFTVCLWLALLVEAVVTDSLILLDQLFY